MDAEKRQSRYSQTKHSKLFTVIMTTKNPLTFRYDVNVLRALAILFVLIFHLDIGAFSNGFLGVDVFFVISGYIITRNISRELAEKRFSLKSFYLRRIRRLFPALFFTVLLTSIFAFWLFSPKDFIDYCYSAIFSVLSAANFYFNFTIDYFNSEVATKPLLHMWSLGVEEQFYLIWPVLLIGASKLKSGLGPVLIIVFLLSLFGTLAYQADMLGPLQSSNKTNEIFYLLPFRIFQLAAGAIFAVYSLSASSKMRSLLFILCLATLTLLSMGWLDTALGIGNLAKSVIATFLTLGLLQLNWSKLASTRLFDFPNQIGKISYSMYLVHWPVVIFYKYSFGYDSWADVVIALVIIYALSVFSYYFVEDKFRLRGKVEKWGRAGWTSLGGLAAAILVTSTAAAAVIQGNGWAWRLSDDAQLAVEDLIEMRKAYWGQYIHYSVNPGSFSDEKLSVVVIGDSFAIDMANILNSLEGVEVFYAGTTNHRCIAFTLPMEGKPELKRRCQHNISRFDRPYPGADTIILSDRFDSFGFTDDRRIPELNKNIDLIRKNGFEGRIIFIGPRPIYKQNVYQYLLSKSDKSGIDRELSTSLRRTIPEMHKRSQELKDMLAKQGVDYIAPFQSLCSKDVCRVVNEEGKLIYFDATHFTNNIGRVFGKDLRAKLQIFQDVQDTLGDYNNYRVIPANFSNEKLSVVVIGDSFGADMANIINTLDDTEVFYAGSTDDKCIGFTLAAASQPEFQQRCQSNISRFDRPYPTADTIVLSVNSDSYDVMDDRHLPEIIKNIDLLRGKGFDGKIVFIGPRPVYSQNIYQYLSTRGEALGAKTELTAYLQKDINDMEMRSKKMRVALAEYGVHYYAPYEYLCDENACDVSDVNGNTLYLDDAHFTNDAGQILADSLRDRLRDSQDTRSFLDEYKNYSVPPANFSGDRLSVVVIGDSFAVDIANIVNTFKDTEVFYAGSTDYRCVGFTLAAIDKPEYQERCKSNISRFNRPYPTTDTIVLSDSSDLHDIMDDRRLPELIKNVDLLRDNGFDGKIVFIGSRPVYSKNVYQYLSARDLVKSTEIELEFNLKHNIDDMKARNQKMRKALAEHGVHYYAPYEYLCDNTKCDVSDPDGHTLYFDNAHFTNDVGQILADSLKDKLRSNHDASSSLDEYKTYRVTPSKFSDAKLSVVIIGDSFAADIANIVNTVEDTEVFYAGSTDYRCVGFTLAMTDKPEFEERCSRNISRFNRPYVNTDVIILADSFDSFGFVDDRRAAELAKNVSILRDNGFKGKIIFIGPRPVYTRNIYHYINALDPPLDTDIAFTRFLRRDIVQMKKRSTQAQAELAKHGVDYFALYQSLCSDNSCKVVGPDGKLIYFDTTHFANTAGNLFANDLMQELRKP